MIVKLKRVWTLLFLLLASLVGLIVYAGLQFGAPVDSDDPKYVMALFENQPFPISDTRFRAAGFQDPLNFYRFKTSPEAIQWLREKFKLHRGPTDYCRGTEMAPSSSNDRASLVPRWWNFKADAVESYHGSNQQQTCCYHLYVDTRELEVLFQEVCV